MHLWSNVKFFIFKSGLGVTSVKGFTRLPYPAQRINAVFIFILFVSENNYLIIHLVFLNYYYA